ncbi:PREDICTED: uncharacterized protein LOC104810492 isoform X2 [Tarenaya hassleriana]|uniref:uncharacterized protein LOC104810492 isoform X2 n=1 Tax=Tarenaya hassleriana TaxID=28532 RepID=UPI00053C085C|nr:PREDICTED: uncharacterized protein LOC104810492 isoform X2 [Tarenaya hassleriana]
MPTLLNPPCHSLSLFSSSSSSRCSGDCCSINSSLRVSKSLCHRTLVPISLRSPALCREFSLNGIGFCSRDDVFGLQDGGSGENEELELLNKPNPVPQTEVTPSEDEDGRAKPDRDEILEPFLKFFKPEGEHGESGAPAERNSVGVEYYDPKPGEFVVGVVVSGNENKLDVNIGADMLGTMLTKEILPLYEKELDYLLCEAEQFIANGKMGVVKDNDEDGVANGNVVRAGRPVVEVGTVVFAEVLGKTLSGRPLLSSRRYFRRIAWHRIQQLNEPIEVKITEWNTGGLLTRIEGLRAFIPKQELVKKVNNFTELKENVGRRLFVQITRTNEDKNDLILSERTAWEKLYLREGTLLEGTVVKILPYGAQVKLGDSNRSGLLHISNITRRRIGSVSDVLRVDENVKVLVVKSLFPDKISLSIADLESEPGLFISNREKVYADAEEMAKKYREKLPAVALSSCSEPPSSRSSFHLGKEEEDTFANWDWFKFETE